MRAIVRSEFWLLAVTMACGAWGVHAVIAIGLCIVGLMIAVASKYIDAYPRARAVGATRTLVVSVCLSLANAAFTATVTYVLGGVIGRWWQLVK